MDQNYETLADIIDQVARFSKNSSSTFQTMIRDEINRAYLDAVNRHDWSELRRIETSLGFSITSNFLFCPPYVNTVLGLIDLTASFYIEPSTIQYMAYDSPATFNTAGKVISWADAGDSPRLTDFSGTAETLTIVSSSSADTSQSVQVNGKDSNNVPIRELAILNGTTNVVTSNTYSDYDNISVDDSHTGIITITGTTSTTVYARIGPNEKTVRYKRLRLYQPAATANSLALLYKKAVKNLINDQDIPEIPISTFLREKAMGIALEYDQNWAAAQQHFQLAEQSLDGAIKRSTAGSDDAIQSRPAIRPRYNSGRWVIGRPGG